MAETVKLSCKRKLSSGSDPPDNPSNLPSCVTSGTVSKAGYKNQYLWFTCILYPQEDVKHRKFMSYIDTVRGLFPYHIYIWHDRDMVSPQDRENDFLEGKPLREVGSLKKPHIHFIFKRSVKCPVTTVRSLFLPWVKEIYGVTSLEDLILYICHADPTSVDDDYKYKYGFSQLQGDTQICRKIIVQNANSVLFYDLFDMISNSETGTLREFLELIKSIDPVMQEEYFTIYRNNQYIFNRLFMEISKMKEDEAYAKSFFAPGWKNSESGEPWRTNYYRNDFIRKTIIKGFDPDNLQRG